MKWQMFSKGVLAFMSPSSPPTGFIVTWVFLVRLPRHVPETVSRTIARHLKKRGGFDRTSRVGTLVLEID